MTDEQLWRGIGRAMQDARIRQGFESTNALKKAKRREAPAVHTMDAIEEGHVGHVGSLSLYCTALRLELWRTFRDVLREHGRERALSADGYVVGRAYERGKNPNLTKSMWGLAAALDAQFAEGRESSTTPSAATTPTTRRRSSPSGRAARRSAGGTKGTDDERP